MWLLPALSTTARLALRVFYRFGTAGPPIPRDGPVLLVANHPNALLDPAAVLATAHRPVRFLAKAPLFSDPWTAWLVRGAGAIPIYRGSDEPALMARNPESFRAAFEALAGGAAVGIFPEGTSHSEPSLARLKTGAARIALGAGRGAAFPLIPVGLSLRDKESFRSEALALAGDPIPWSDLAARGPDDAAAVRELTRRIEEGLRRLTVNLHRWEDAPLVEMAMDIYVAEHGLPIVPSTRIEGLREVAEGLARIQAGGPEWLSVARDVRRHGRILGALGLRPHQLAQPGRSAAARWAARSFGLLLLTAPLSLLGAVVFFLPYRATGALVARARPSSDLRATYKLVAGAVVHFVWAVLLTALVAWRLGLLAAAATLVALPLLGALTLWLLEWRGSARGAARRFLVRRRRRALLGELGERQRELAARLAGLRAPRGGASRESDE